MEAVSGTSDKGAVDDLAPYFRICELIAEGDSVEKAAKTVGIHPRTFYRALNREDAQELNHSYTRARRARADARAEEIDEIKRRMMLDREDSTYIDPQTGRVLIDAIKWQAGKENQTRYGDHVVIEDRTPKNALTREEIKAQLAASGLRASEIFEAITKRAEPAPIEIEEIAQSDESEELPE